MTDRQGKIHHANQAAAALFAIPPDHLIHKPLVVLVEPDARSQVWARLAQPESPQNGELTLSPHNRPGVTVAIATAVVTNDQGQHEAMLWSLRDITQQKQLEQQLQAARDDLERQVEARTAELVQAQAHLERTQRLDSLGTLATGLAHDLRNALTPATSGADLLLLPHFELPPAARSIVELISTSAHRSLDLMQNLLLFARGTPAERVPLLLDRVLTEVLPLIERSTAANIVVSPLVGADGSAWVEADSTQMHQVLMNLCLNACDAMAEEGTLSVTLETCQLDPGDPRLMPLAVAGCYRLITIADTGRGIDPSLINHIFDPFFTTKALKQGTGMGLAIVYRIVQSHGGFIWVTSWVGGGSQFRVYLPAIASPVSTPSPSEPPADLAYGQGERVLIVDDNPAVCQASQTLLETYGYVPLVVDNGPAAVALYQQGHTRSAAEAIDLVLLDIDMPELSGLEVLQRLMSIDPQVAVVVMSGTNRDREAILAQGAKAFVLKPYGAADMLVALSQA
ncbi:MAG: ATP-binding protein, partial [Cyanobacteria bacterium J06638_6]